jgi:hypothetical protein
VRVVERVFEMTGCSVERKEGCLLRVLMKACNSFIHFIRRLFAKSVFASFNRGPPLETLRLSRDTWAEKLHFNLRQQHRFSTYYKLRTELQTSFVSCMGK